MKVLSEQELKEKLAEIKPASSQESVKTELPELKKPDIEKELKKYFLALLARREYSKHELRTKALERQTSLELIEKLIDELSKDNYQSDQRFAEMFIRARVNKLSGPIKIRMELKQKGVSPELIEQTLKNCECDWFELAADCARKKYKPLKPNADFNEKQKARAKLTRFLHGRGFNGDQVRYAVESVEGR